MEKKSFSINIIWLICIILVVIGGIAIRTCTWLHDTTFFIDEGMLMINIQDYKFGDLFFPLDYNQQAAPLFLILTKIIYNIFAYNELALRFPIYLSSCLSLVVFFFLCRKFLSSYFSVFIAVFLMAVNINLIFYSQFLKQYSWDMLILMIALLILLKFDFSFFDKKKAFIAGTIWGISFWLSYTLVFVVGGFCLVYLIKYLYEKNYEKIKTLLFFVCPVSVLFCIYYYTNLAAPSFNQFLQYYWSKFSGFFPNTWQDYTNIITFIWSSNKFFIVAITMLMIIGILNLYKENKLNFYILVSPVFMTLLAGAMHIYPFAHRLIIFLFPIFFIIACKPFDKLNLNNKFYALFLVLALFCLKYTFSVAELKNVILNKDYFKMSNAKEFLAKLKQSDYKQGEYIYVPIAVKDVILSYDTDRSLIGSVITMEYMILEHENGISRSLARMPKNEVIYFYLSDFYWNRNYSKHIKGWIDNHCTVLHLEEEQAGTFIKCLNNK